MALPENSIVPFDHAREISLHCPEAAQYHTIVNLALAMESCRRKWSQDQSKKNEGENRVHSIIYKTRGKKTGWIQ